MANATVSIYLDKTYTKKDGTSRFYIQITIDRKIKRIPLNLHVNPDYFNHVQKKIKEKKEVPTAKKDNLYLQAKKTEFEQIILDLERKKQPVSFKNIINVYDNSEINGNFIQFARNRLKNERNLIKESTYKDLEYIINKLERHQPDLTIYEINEEWLENYRNYLIEELGNKKNTLYSSFSMIKKYINYAYKKSIIKENPFHNFSFEIELKEKEYINLEEQDILQQLYEQESFLDLTKHHELGKTNKSRKQYHETLQQILISCYSGLRHSDLKKLRYKHIQKNMIILPMGKSRKDKEKTLRIPISLKLSSVLDLEGNKNPNDKVYKGFVRVRNEISKIMRKIMKAAGINKYLTFHCTRHSFAINSLTLGMSIETLSDLMGHSDIKTTQIYAKVIDEKRKNEMSKWNKISNQNKDKTSHNTIHCPDCDNIVISFEKGIINLNKLSLQCPYCSKKFTYDIKNNSVVQLHKVV